MSNRKGSDLSNPDSWSAGYIGVYIWLRANDYKAWSKHSDFVGWIVGDSRVVLSRTSMLEVNMLLRICCIDVSWQHSEL